MVPLTLIIFAVVGVLLFAINNYVPMPAGLKLAINILAMVAVGVVILHSFGVIANIDLWHNSR